MQKFKFQFEDILKIKKNLQEQAEQAYALVAGQRQNLINKNSQLQESIYRNKEDFMNSIKPGDSIPMGAFFYEESFDEGAKIKIANNEKKIQEFDQKLVKLLADLQKATMECKKFEKLKENAYKAYKEEANKINNKELDEIGSTKYFYEHLQKETI